MLATLDQAGRCILRHRGGLLRCCAKALLVSLGILLLQPSISRSGDSLSAPAPLIEKEKPVDWWFVFKFNAASYPACAVGAQRSCIFGGEMQDYRGQFSQQFVYASSDNSSLKNGTDCLGNSVKDPLGATFDQIYNGDFYYVVWNDQLYNDPAILKCGGNCNSPWAHSKGMLAWNDSGDGMVLQVTTPSWPGSGSNRYPRISGNTLGCGRVNNLQSSQQFFSVKLIKADVLKVLKAMANASVATDPANPQLVRNGGPADIQEAVRNLGTQSDSKAYTDDTLANGIRLISKPSRLHVPPWQMVSAILGGVPLRVATWWASPRIYSTSAATDIKCWDSSLGKPGAVEIATAGYWAGQEIRLIDPGNHAKIGVSTGPDHNFAIFGDLNQQGELSQRCNAAQNGRGGLFYIIEDRKLAVGLRNLVHGDTAIAGIGIDNSAGSQAGPSSDQTNLNKLSLPFKEPIPEAIRKSSLLELNGKEFKIEGIDHGSTTLRLLGRESGPRKGLNFLRVAGQTLTYWYAGTQLESFSTPYPPQSSYAIIAAIDDYKREHDPLKRGPTGYPALEHMVEKAEELRKVLVTLGFPQDNIRTFYNEKATTQNLQDALTDFYEGGAFANASRVFFYFGGHGDSARVDSARGDKAEMSGFLITFDFDSKRPTATGFLLSDFVSRHFPHVQAKHLMVAIDSCFSGLAVPGMRTLGSEPKPRDFATLAQIKAAVDYRARDLIVAGTGAERALAEAGGIFTQALIDGLTGKGDLYKDGVIQFDELSVYVKRTVSARARAMGVQQVPSALKATAFGDGEMVFLLP